jgi:multicomponent K+:H+ antiporter subunit A
VIAFGIIVAALTGVASWLAGYPFLTSSYGYFTFPPIETFELATASAFDLGVFLCVLGAVMLALESLSRMAHRAEDRPPEDPMDINPKIPLPEGRG